MRRYLVLFRGMALRETKVYGRRDFYAPCTATRTVGMGKWRGPGATTYRSLGEVNGAINGDYESRRTRDNTVVIDDYTIVALEVRP